MTSPSLSRRGQIVLYALSVALLCGVEGFLISGGLVWALARVLYVPSAIIFALLAVVMAITMVLTVMLFVRTLRVEHVLLSDGDPLSVSWNPFAGTRLAGRLPFMAARNTQPDLADQSTSAAVASESVVDDAIHRH